MEQFPKTTQQERDRMFLYCALMEEICLRIEGTNRVLQNASSLGPLHIYEFGHLQLRMICELIAMSCLVAHGQMTRKLMDTWEADKIISAMQKLKPHFYPQPIRIVRDDKRVHMEGIEKEGKHLARTELSQLWGRCGSVLHTGPLSKHMHPDKVTTPDLQDVVRWGSKVVGLLNSHMIALSETRTILVGLKDNETDRPKGTIMDFNLAAGTMNLEHFALPKIQSPQQSSVVLRFELSRSDQGRGKK